MAAEYRIGHCLGGCPEGVGAENRLVVRSLYALSFDRARGAGSWMAYRMRAGALGIASSLPRALIDDPELELRATDFDGFPRGDAGQDLVRAGLLPLMNVAGTPYWFEANLVSASAVRSLSLERGAWSGLEWSLRNLLARRGEVSVVTGPIYATEARRGESDAGDGANPVAIGFFKLVATAAGELSAFRFEQGFPVHVHHCQARTTLEAIEAETGLHFFPEWDRSVQGRESLDTQLGCY